MLYVYVDPPDSCVTALLHLVRHGAHDEVGKCLSGRSGIRLNALGQAQADALAEWLGPMRVASVHCSPQRRALDTAAPLAARLGLEVQVTSALDEIDFGSFSGRSFAALAAEPEWIRWNAERESFRCPSGETMAEAVARARAYLTALPSDETPALCISHCDVIRGLVTAGLGLGYDRMFAFDCDPASLTTLVMEEGGMRLATLNAQARR